MLISSQPMAKPLPPEGYDPNLPQQPAPPPGPGQPQAGGPGAAAGPYMINNEEAFVQAYVGHRSPRMMVWTNRTIHGDPVNAAHLQELVQGKPATADVIGATPDDYALIETSIVQYFDNSGQVVIQDADARGRSSIANGPAAD